MKKIIKNCWNTEIIPAFVFLAIAIVMTIILVKDGHSMELGAIGFAAVTGAFYLLFLLCLLMRIATLSTERKTKLPTHLILLIGMPCLLFVIALCFMGNVPQAFNCACYFCSIIWSCWFFIRAIRSPVLFLIGIFVPVICLQFSQVSLEHVQGIDVILAIFLGHGFKSAAVLFFLLVGIDVCNFGYYCFNSKRSKIHKN